MPDFARHSDASFAAPVDLVSLFKEFEGKLPGLIQNFQLQDLQLQDVQKLLPEQGMGDREALAYLSSIVLDGATDFGAETFFAHMDPPTPWVTWVTTFWNAALNQNLLHPSTAPVARRFEEQLISWLAPEFGSNGGQVVPGSTIANLTALWAARDLRHATEVVASADAHISVRKSAQILGLKYREVPVDVNRRLMQEMLGSLSSSVLVLTVGTTAAGAIDPLGAGRGACWRHIDAAWAGPLRLCRRYRHLLDGIEAADSVAISAHKWLFQPKESALVFFSDFEEAKSAISFGGPYLAAPNIGVLGSHGATAIPLMAMLLAWGREGLESRLVRCMEAAERLAQLVEDSSEFILFAQPATGIVLWRPRNMSVEEALPRLEDVGISSTTIDGVRWFRSVAANPLVDVEKYFLAIRNAISRVPSQTSALSNMTPR